MRLQIQEGAQVAGYDTCARFSYGATKDYSIDVIGETDTRRERERDRERTRKRVCVRESEREV